MLKFIIYLVCVLTFSLSVFISVAFSQNSDPDFEPQTSQNEDSLRVFEFPQIDIIGRKPDLLQRVPGSATIIYLKNLNMMKSLSGNEIFRSVAGINAVDEEGAGLRLNIGIRGLDPDRSRTVLMLEDGVPVSLAPYGEPEMYYTPSMDRMSGLEILKGSGSILFGPQTIGGVINYITSDPPLISTSKISLRGGQYGYFTGNLSYGTTVSNAGMIINFLHKQADDLGILNFHTNDVTAKIKFNTGDKSRIGVKLAAYDERSNSTYIGLTQSMYDDGEYYKIIAPNDELKIRRYSANFTHEYYFSNDANLKTTLFVYTTSRDWLRQDFSRNPVSNPVAVYGDTSVSGGAIYMRNSTGNRNRQFDVAGIEPRLFYSYKIGKMKNDLDAGIRFLYEKANEQRINGKKADAESGDLVEDEIRTGYAISSFIQNRFYVTDRFNVIPGVRFEKFFYGRDIHRLGSRDTSITSNDNIFSIVPGIGLNFNLNEVTFYGGVHRGFAPPRVKDAITNSGISLNLDAETSWNSELGIRGNLYNGISFDVTGYRLDFENQVIPVSESSGGLGTGFVNGGRTLHNGIEASLSFDFGKLLNSGYSVILTSRGTFSGSEYSSDRYIQSGSETVNIKGNELPYAPKIMLSNSIEFYTPSGLGFILLGNYTGRQFTDELNTVDPSPTGETGLMPAYFTLDATARYRLSSLNSTFYFSVKNLLDEKYIASRRPQGIKTGLPRVISAGIDLAF